MCQIEMKSKKSSQTADCRMGTECTFGRLCKFKHNENEKIEGTLKFAIITTTDKKEMERIVKKDKEEFMNKRLISK